jgi:hypothetical protein
MRLRYAALVGVVFAAGCLVPAYEADLPDGVNAGSGGAKTMAGASSVAGTPSSGGSSAGSNAEDCSATQKRCAGQCVDIDDPNYGCTETSCDMAECPATDGALSCEGGKCVIGSCPAGSKKCDGKCVSVDDPTYGCGETSCDTASCPVGGQGPLVCNAGKCEVGTCGADTKECDGKCVPLDANHGCAATSCDACASNESCEGSPSACKCVPELVCMGKQCGSFTNRCGEKIDCFDTCSADQYGCDQGECVECVEPADCPSNPTNPCAVPKCESQQCLYDLPGAGTPCGAGTCSDQVAGLCEYGVVEATAGVSIDATEVTRYQYMQFVAAAGQDTSGQPVYCAWNDSYEPAFLYPPSQLDYNKPVVGVDWCDAYAYCKHVGRRLCGKIGGGALISGDFAKPAQSQWMLACSKNGARVYPYGPTTIRPSATTPTTTSTRPTSISMPPTSARFHPARAAIPDCST